MKMKEAVTFLKKIFNIRISNLIKSTTLILLSVVFANMPTIFANSLEVTETGVKQDSLVTQANNLSGPSVINVMDEVYTRQVNINSKNVKPEYYIQKNSDYTHVDSLFNALKTFTLAIISVKDDIREEQRIREVKLKAKAYSSIPLSILLWLILLIIALNRQNKLLTDLFLFLLIASIIGTFIVLPILLEGLNVVPFLSGL
jgi:NAD/NADP transhydrogenase beta subunit